MADTGYNWDDSWSFVKDSGGGDWDGDAIADTGNMTSNTAISNDGKAACIVGVTLEEDNTGAIDGVVTIYVLGHSGDGYEEIGGVGCPYKFEVTPVQNDIVYLQFAVDPKYYDDFLIAMENESGQELATTVQYKQATVPPAS